MSTGLLERVEQLTRSTARNSHSAGIASPHANSPADSLKGVDVVKGKPNDGAPTSDVDELFNFEITNELRELASGYDSIGDRVREHGVPRELLANLFLRGSDES